MKLYIPAGTHICHRSVQSQLSTKNVTGTWHIPNYSLISGVPIAGKNNNNFLGGSIKSFSHIQLHAIEACSSLNEVCEGVVRVKNHDKNICIIFASKMSLFDQMVQKNPDLPTY